MDGQSQMEDHDVHQSHQPISIHPSMSQGITSTNVSEALETLNLGTDEELGSGDDASGGNDGEGSLSRKQPAPMFQPEGGVEHSYRTETSTDSEQLLIRSPDQTSGVVSERRAFKEYIEKHFPCLDKSVYVIPSVFIGHSTFKESAPEKREGPFAFFKYDPGHCYSQGEEGERRVALCMEYLLKYWCSEDGPAFIVTQYHYDNLSKKTYEGKGEHDVLIIHYRFGLLCIQVKSCLAKSVGALKEPIDTGLNQCKKDLDFIEKEFPHLSRLSKTCILALPNTSTEMVCQFRNYEKCLEQHEVLCLDHLPNPESDFESQSLQKQQLAEWWKRFTTQRLSGFDSHDDYRGIIERYVGCYSTVTIPKPRQTKRPGNTLGECVAEVGNRYMTIVLTPTQIRINNSDVKRLIIRGNYGSGKTVLLILKAVKLLKAEQKVAVISMSDSPLHYALKEQIVTGLGDECKPFLTVRQVTDQESLAGVLKECADEQRNVLIDEFPSFLHGNANLHGALDMFPKEYLLWIVMTREREETLSKGVQEVFEEQTNTTGSSQQELKFKDVRLLGILRCPPSIFHLWPDFRQPQKSFSEQNIKIEDLKKKLSTVDLIPPFSRSTNITHVTVRDLRKRGGKTKEEKKEEKKEEEEKRPFFKQLKGLKIPVAKSNSDTLDSNYILPDSDNSHLAENEKVAEIGFGGNTTICVFVKNSRLDHVEQLSYNKKRFAVFLYKLGFGDDSDTISRIARQGNVGNRDIRYKWSDLTFMDMPYYYSLLSNMGVSLTSDRPCQGTDLRVDIISDKQVHISAISGFEGYHRNADIEIITDELVSNVSFLECRPLDGPSCVYIDHNHTCILENCGECKKQLTSFLSLLGLTSSQTDHTLQGHGDLITTRNDLDWTDVIILDDRIEAKCETKLLKQCGMSVTNRLNTELDPRVAFGSTRSVDYMRPEQFQGLERKVVMVVTSGEPEIPSPLGKEVVRDGIEVAISRCTSQLLILRVWQ
ncbi:uncharacterized protein [Haliotis cracherodii]|uniref:uncharacterized protein isoform X1 n=1 Tax=Haliotis cracherodii TaxID=6455 RepID=UPI0039EA7A54